MKTTAITNTEICIQANIKKAGDFEMSIKIAEEMMADGYIDLAHEIIEDEQIVQLFAADDSYQAADLKEIYKRAKAKVMAA